MNTRLNKILKILFVIEFILISLIIVLVLIGSKEMPTAYAVKETQSTEKTEFKVTTKAVCEEKLEHILCYDKLFIRCNGKEYVIEENNTNPLECNNIKLKSSEIVSGSGRFSKEWADPR